MSTVRGNFCLTTFETIFGALPLCLVLLSLCTRKGTGLPCLGGGTTFFGKSSWLCPDLFGSLLFSSLHRPKDRGQPGCRWENLRTSLPENPGRFFSMEDSKDDLIHSNQWRQMKICELGCGEVEGLSAPKSQMAIAAIFHRRGQTEGKFRWKSAIFAWNSQNQIVIASDGSSHLEIATFPCVKRRRKSQRFPACGGDLQSQSQESRDFGALCFLLISASSHPLPQTPFQFTPSTYDACSAEISCEILVAGLPEHSTLKHGRGVWWNFSGPFVQS